MTQLQYDEYGFLTSNEHFTHESWLDAQKQYQKILVKREEKWKKLLKHDLPKKSNDLKRYCRNGIPKHLRRKVWFKYSGAETKMDLNPGLYAALNCKEAQQLENGIIPANEFIDVISRGTKKLIRFAKNFSRKYLL